MESVIRVANELVRVLDFAPIPVYKNGEEAGELLFRVDILRRVQDKKLYTVRIWRADYIRVRPSFADREAGDLEEADERVLTEDVTLFPADFSFAAESIDEAEQQIILAMGSRFTK